ncbi:NAD(P)H-binding protein [Phytoactinopolyspora endophytica]|uniref:NAD(P)H-binding protein n=1 Tax=Phytoactinopolyspora endophytica TaxID=1642495 RepID=UPI0013E9E4EC|nr:NAD(P)H-binding protein [Phytoactinopolyspora endophytica]
MSRARRGVEIRIAVTGSSGSLGGQVVRLLAADGRHQVVALARRTVTHEPDDLVTSRYAEYTDLDSLRSALRGVDVLVFVSSDGDAAKMMIHHQNVVRAAADSEVAHIVYLSGIDADTASPFCYAYTNGYTEGLIASSGCAFSIARASIYTEFFASFLRSARESGEVRVPAADGRLSLVSRADVGRCLAALATAPPTGRHHDITGPVSLDVRTITGLAAQAWGLPLRFADVSPDTFSAELANAGQEPWWVYAFSTMFASVREQRWDAVSDEVRCLTGSDPLNVADVLGRP